jgi:hypothetical protein
MWVMATGWKWKAIKLFDLSIQNEFKIEFDLKLIFINRFLTLKDSERFQILFSLIVEKLIKLEI